MRTTFLILMYIALIVLSDSLIVYGQLTEDQLEEPYTVTRIQILLLMAEYVTQMGMPELDIRTSFVPVENESNNIKVYHQIRLPYDTDWILDPLVSIPVKRSRCKSFIEMPVYYFVTGAVYCDMLLSAYDDFKIDLIYFTRDAEGKIAATYESGQITWHNACGTGTTEYGFGEIGEIIEKVHRSKTAADSSINKPFKILYFEDIDKIYLVEGAYLGMMGLDIPEGREDLRQRRVEYLNEVLTAFQPVTITRDSRKESGSRRLDLGYVYIDDVCINEELIKMGLVIVTDRYPFDEKEKYKQLEAEAKRKGVGIWQ